MIRITVILVLIIFLKTFESNGQSPVLLDNFPVILDSMTGPGLNSGPVIADFDNDGKDEILLSYYKGQGNSKVFLINSEGNLLIGWTKIIFDPNPYCAAGDVNNDGYIDIVLRTKDSLFVFDHNGVLLTGFPVYFPSQALTCLALYDLDNDKNLEIISTGLDKVIVFDHDGSIRNGWPVTLPGSISSRIFSSPVSIADLNNDGTPEILIPSSFCPTDICSESNINIFEPDGTQFPGSPIMTEPGYFFRHNPISIYYENDSLFFLVNSIFENNDNVTTKTIKYSGNGLPLNTYYSNSYINSSSPISIGINEMNKNPFYAFGYQEFPSYVLDDNLNLSQGWPQITNSFAFQSFDIINISEKIRLLSTEIYSDTTGGYSDNFGFIKGFDLNGIQSNWSPIRSRGIPVSSPVYCDLNNDGKLDLVSLNSFDNNSEGFGMILYAWTFNSENFDLKKLDWPMYGHDRYRTFQHGFIPPDEPVGIQPLSTAVPERFSLSQNYPNPFNPSTVINYELRVTSFAKLIVYDVLGHELATLVNEKQNAGSYRISFDGSNLSSGVYFYKLDAGEFSETKRMILLK